MLGVDDGESAGGRAFRMALEVATDHLAIPAPVVVRVAGGMEADDSFAGLEKSLQRVTACAREPFGFRLLGIRGRADEHDRLEAREFFRREDFGILGGLDDVTGLLSDLPDGHHGRGNRIVSVAGAARVYEYGCLVRRDGGLAK